MATQTKFLIKIRFSCNLIRENRAVRMKYCDGIFTMLSGMSGVEKEEIVALGVYATIMIEGFVIQLQGVAMLI